MTTTALRISLQDFAPKRALLRSYMLLSMSLPSLLCAWFLFPNIPYIQEGVLFFSAFLGIVIFMQHKPYWDLFIINRLINLPIIKSQFHAWATTLACQGHNASFFPFSVREYASLPLSKDFHNVPCVLHFRFIPVNSDGDVLTSGAIYAYPTDKDGHPQTPVLAASDAHLYDMTLQDLPPWIQVFLKTVAHVHKGYPAHLCVPMPAMPKSSAHSTLLYMETVDALFPKTEEAQETLPTTASPL